MTRPDDDRTDTDTDRTDIDRDTLRNHLGSNLDDEVSGDWSNDRNPRTITPLSDVHPTSAALHSPDVHAASRIEQAEAATPPAIANPADFDHEFVQELESITESIAALDARYRQIQRDRQQRDQLRAHLQTLSPSNTTAKTRDELTQLRDRLELLELNLESSLFAWSSLREPIWFGLRYGGLGFILGWLLHAWTQ